MYLKTIPIVIGLSILFINSAAGQYRKSMQDYYLSKGIGSGRMWQRISIGAGKYFVSGNEDMHYTGYDGGTNTYLDKTVKQSFKAKQAYAIHLGTFFPVTMITDNSMIALNVEAFAAHASLATDSILFLGTKKFADAHETYTVGLPISFEFKSGGEVTLSRKTKTIFSIGAGIIPAIINSDDYNAVKPFRFTPFIKAEAGFVAGIAVKLRATAYLGNSDYFVSTAYNIADPAIYDKLQASGKGSNGYTLSLILMPFSWSWNSDF